MEAEVALALFFTGMINRLRTDPLTTREWANLHDCDQRTMRRVLQGREKQERAWKFGGRWQLLLVDAPPPYQLDCGFKRLAVELADALEIAHFRTVLAPRASIVSSDGSAKDQGPVEFIDGNDPPAELPLVSLADA